MSGFWSAWVMVLACITAGVSLLLFLWAIWMRIPVVEDGTTGHVWAHGTVREAVRPLPWWWIAISVGSFLSAAGYLILYPGFGNAAGMLGWTSAAELERNAAADSARLETLLAPLRALSIEDLATHKDALAIGHRLFLDNCAACHGTEAHGNTVLGAPNLVDADWVYGGDSQSILTSILDGRSGVMPAQGDALGPNGVNEVAAYVVSHRGTQVPAEWVAAGKTRFETICAACHGVDGKGNPAVGAPNLFDDVWIYGGNIESVVASVTGGRNGVMPPWRQRLNADEVRLIAAWVISKGPDGAASRASL